MKKRYGTVKRKRFAFRSSRKVEMQLDTLMRHYGYFTYAATFRALIHEAYERLPEDAKVEPE